MLMSKKKIRKSSGFKIKSRAFVYWFLGISAVLLGLIFINQNILTKSCANSISCIQDLTGKFDPNLKEGEFMGKKVNVPTQIAIQEEQKVVLGDSTSDKHIYIDLSSQKLYAKEGDRIIYEFLISSGKWGRTPTGDFMTWIKLRSTRMKGGNQALGTFYDLPNVPYTMYFYNNEIPKRRGFGIHGAYWHNNFGHPMSHGCINMKPEEAGLIYEWANPQSTGHTTYVDDEHPGTPVTIYGTAPWQ